MTTIGVICPKCKKSIDRKMPGGLSEAFVCRNCSLILEVSCMPGSSMTVTDLPKKR